MNNVVTISAKQYSIKTFMKKFFKYIQKQRCIINHCLQGIQDPVATNSTLINLSHTSPAFT